VSQISKEEGKRRRKRERKKGRKGWVRAASGAILNAQSTKRRRVVVVLL